MTWVANYTLYKMLGYIGQCALYAISLKAWKLYCLRPSIDPNFMYGYFFLATTISSSLLIKCHEASTASSMITTSKYFLLSFTKIANLILPRIKARACPPRKVYSSSSSDHTSPRKELRIR